MSDSIARFLANVRSRGGQGIVEYGLLLVLITVVLIVALTVIGGTTGNTMDTSSNVIGTTGG